MTLNVIELLHLDALYGVFLQVFLSITVCLSMMSDGMGVGWTSSKIAELTNENATAKITLEQASFIGTLPIYLYPIMLPITIYSSDCLGRKLTIIWAAICICLCWMFLYFSEYIEYIYVGMILRGVGGFIIYAVPPMYIAEIAQANIRGFLSILIPIFMNLGIFLSYISVACIPLKDIAVIGFVIISIMLPIFIFAPESPYFLFMKNKPEEAKDSLKKFRGADNINFELDDIKTSIEKNILEKSSIMDFFTDKVCRKVSFIVCSVQIFQQTSGIDSILLFLQVILQSSGSNLSSNYSSIIFGAGKLFACSVSLLFVDKLGRKCLLIISCTVASLALFLLGMYFYVKNVLHYDTSAISWLPLTILMVYILGYNIGLGTVPFILAAEMYPTKYKAYGVAVAQIMYCISMISITELFALLKDNYGFHCAFWLLSVLTVVGLFFSVYYVYETKGKTLKQILIELE